MKLSGGFRISAREQSYEDVKPYAVELLNAFGVNRCIWGSDWSFLNPDVGPEKRPMKIAPVEYGREASVFSGWVPSEEVRQKILWDNPSRFFGFSKSAKLGELSVAF
ncbi:MAG: hypothetical protein EXQ83_00670 [Xanthobacteraceae bacterium]|nr:hypothetical protein [Xanthobacteraceae bacterium]